TRCHSSVWRSVAAASSVWPRQCSRPASSRVNVGEARTVRRAMLLAMPLRPIEEAVMTQLPHVLKRIRLNLARSKEFPSGSDQDGYEFVAPLDADGYIDVELWRKYREHCGVRRFWDGEDDEFGRLVHRPGGAEHARWVFDYDETAEEDDEAGY